MQTTDTYILAARALAALRQVIKPNCFRLLVTPTLNEIIGENNWKVDITNPKKLLTVTTENLKEVIKAVEKAGYKAESLS